MHTQLPASIQKDIVYEKMSNKQSLIHESKDLLTMIPSILADTNKRPSSHVRRASRTKCQVVTLGGHPQMILTLWFGPTMYFLSNDILEYVHQKNDKLNACKPWQIKAMTSLAVQTIYTNEKLYKNVTWIPGSDMTPGAGQGWKMFSIRGGSPKNASIKINTDRTSSLHLPWISQLPTIESYKDEGSYVYVFRPGSLLKLEESVFYNVGDDMRNANNGFGHASKDLCSLSLKSC